jgi:hypothetical protein
LAAVFPENSNVRLRAPPLLAKPSRVLGLASLLGFKYSAFEDSSEGTAILPEEDSLAAPMFSLLSHTTELEDVFQS